MSNETTVPNARTAGRERDCQNCGQCEDCIEVTAATHEAESAPLRHVWYDCKCGETGCQFCDGGLGWCTVCDAFEGQLLPVCPGRKLTPEENDKNYADNLARWRAMADSRPSSSNPPVAPSRADLCGFAEGRR